jgi:hypothetical protein
VLADEADKDILYVQSGQPINLSLRQRQMSVPAAGYQAFLSFDQNMISYVGGAYTYSPYGMTVLSMGATNGLMDLAARDQPLYVPAPLCG